jgi:type III pantothenate kinase
MSYPPQISPAALPFSTLWLALVVGNSRLHWGAFESDRWLGGWHTAHLSLEQAKDLQASGFLTASWQPLGGFPPLPEHNDYHHHPELWIASVVDTQTDLWQDYAHLRLVNTAQVPLAGAYTTLGVDRALTLLGAGVTYGWPVLVVDCGTALTLTAGNDQALLGGAILPGLSSQLRALHDYTDSLPPLSLAAMQSPNRWAMTTAEAMLSGVFYTLLAGIRDFMADWWRQFPAGQVVFTGGDGEIIATGLTASERTLTERVHLDPNLMFWGLRVCRQRLSTDL